MASVGISDVEIIADVWVHVLRPNTRDERKERADQPESKTPHILTPPRYRISTKIFCVFCDFSWPKISATKSTKISKSEPPSLVLFVTFRGHHAKRVTS